MTKVRAWLVTALPLISLCLLLLTIVQPDWIEEIFGVEPDGGDGSLEALVIWALVVVTAVSGMGAVMAWRRAVSRRPAEPAPGVDGGGAA
jgi:hypothetical protein